MRITFFFRGFWYFYLIQVTLDVGSWQPEYNKQKERCRLPSMFIKSKNHLCMLLETHLFALQRLRKDLDQMNSNLLQGNTKRLLNFYFYFKHVVQILMLNSRAPCSKKLVSRCTYELVALIQGDVLSLSLTNARVHIGLLTHSWSWQLRLLVNLDINCN